MKKNLLPGLMLAFLPLNLSSLPNFEQNNPEALMCREIPVSSKYTITEKQIQITPTPVAVSPTPTIAPIVTPQAQVIIAPEELESLFEQYAQEYGIDSSTLKIIAKCESRFNPSAQSKNGLYGGLFQYSASTWVSTRRAMGLDENAELRFNAEEAIKTSAYKIANGGIGAWQNCAKKAQNN